MTKILSLTDDNINSAITCWQKIPEWLFRGKGVKFMGPVTTNPWLIAIINMAIVFAVLIALGVLMSLIQVIDPTKKKK